MARSKGPKYYAVAVGRDGPRIYEDWATTEQAVKGFKGAKYISHRTEKEARDWLAGHLPPVTVSVLPESTRRNSEEHFYSNDEQMQGAALSASASGMIPSSTPEFKPRLTTRYSPYPSTSTRSGPPSSRSSVHGVPPMKPPRSTKSSQPTSSQANPITVSSDVDDDLVMTGFSGSTTHQAHAGPSTSRGLSTPTHPTNRPDCRPGPAQGVFPYEADQAIHAHKVSTAQLDMPNGGALPIRSNEPELSEEQKIVFKRIMKGESIFFTGSAGVGKSVLTRAIIKALRQKYPLESEVAVTATTGIAATNIGGCTLHSWAGLGLAKMSVDKLYFSLTRSKSKADVVQRWVQCKALVIDEVSMLHGTFFDKLEQIARMLRHNSLPFGGIQLVITGDFFQLPPISDYNGPNQPAQPVQFVFESKGWKEAALKTVVLQQVFRQRDNKFVNILNEMRMGRASKEAIEALSALSRKVQYEDDVEPTCLYAKRNQVLSENTRRLKQLKGSNVSYSSQDFSGKEADAPYKDKYPQENELRAFLDKNTIVEQAIDLKVGAQVMLVKNLKAGLVNGSVGRVIGFASAAQIAQTEEPAYGNSRSLSDRVPDFPDVETAISARFKDDDCVAEQEWLASHGYMSQAAGRSVKEVKVLEQVNATTDNSHPVDAPAITNNANATPPLPPSLANINIASAALSEKEKKRLKAELGYSSEDNITDADLEEPAMPGIWPVVEFTDGQRMLLPPMEFTVEDANGRLEAKRIQIPLILAWALSIHKSQGQTIERVKVDLGDIFETGQAYVALSRATQMETLQVLRFYPNRVKAHPKVVKWYQQILDGGKS